LFRTFYLFGAILNVPVLALGTVYLLAGRRAADRTAAGVALGAAFAAGVLVTASLHGPLPHDQLAQGSKVFTALPRILAAVASAGGAVVIVAGAAWSAWRVRRNGAPRHLLSSNALIATGTLILASSGTLNSIFGAMTAFAITLLAGIVVLFCGFLLASSARSAASRPISPARPWYPGGAIPPEDDRAKLAATASPPARAAVRAQN
jgi:heme A synthase